MRKVARREKDTIRHGTIANLDMPRDMVSSQGPGALEKGGGDKVGLVRKTGAITP